MELISDPSTSEFSILTTDNVKIEEGYLHFYQPKVDEWRMSPLEPEIITMSTRKSYKNLIDKWRPQVANQYSKNFVYLKPNGEPFQENQLRQFLNRKFKPIWSDYHPTCMRDWCAIARLIRTKVRTTTKKKEGTFENRDPIHRGNENAFRCHCH